MGEGETDQVRIHGAQTDARHLIAVQLRLERPGSRRFERLDDLLKAFRGLRGERVFRGRVASPPTTGRRSSERADERAANIHVVHRHHHVMHLQLLRTTQSALQLLVMSTETHQHRTIVNVL